MHVRVMYTVHCFSACIYYIYIDVQLMFTRRGGDNDDGDHTCMRIGVAMEQSSLTHITRLRQTAHVRAPPPPSLTSPRRRSV